MVNSSEQIHKNSNKKRSKALKRKQRLIAEALRLKLSVDYWLRLSHTERQAIRKAVRRVSRARQQATLNNPEYIDQRLDIAHLKYISKFSN